MIPGFFGAAGRAFSGGYRSPVWLVGVHGVKGVFGVSGELFMSIMPFFFSLMLLTIETPGLSKAVAERSKNIGVSGGGIIVATENG